MEYTRRQIIDGTGFPDDERFRPVSDERYNGWANNETWSLNLYLGNDQGLYEMTRERVREAVSEHMGDTYYPYAGTADEQKRYSARVAGEAVKDMWDELTDPDEGLMECRVILDMVRDIGSEYRIDWDETGAHWLADIAEDEQ